MDRAILEIVVSGVERSVAGLQKITRSVSGVENAARRLSSAAPRESQGASAASALRPGGSVRVSSAVSSALDEVVGAFQAAVPVLGAFGGGLGGLIRGISAASAAAQGLSAGFALFDFAARRNQEVMRRQIEAIQNETQARIQAQQSADSGDWESLIQGTRALAIELQTLERQREALIATAVTQSSYGDQLRTVGEAFVNSVLTSIDGIQRGINVYNQAGEQINAVNERIAQIIAQMRQNTQAFEAAQRRSNVLAAEQELLSVRQEAVQVMRQLGLSETQATRDFQRQIEVEARQRRREDALANRQRLIEAKRMQRDFNRQVEDFERQQMRSMRDLRRQEAREDYLSQRQLGRTLFFMQRDYDRSLIDQARNRNRELAREAQRYARDRLRMEQDLNRSLFDAELENNALQYLQLKRGADIERRRADEDRAIRLQEEQEDYHWQLSEQRLQFERQRADTLEAYAIERADLAEQRRWQREDMRIAMEDQRADMLMQYARQREDALREFAQQRADLIEQRQYENMINAENFRYQLEQLRYQGQLQIAQLAIREQNALSVIQAGGAMSLNATRYWQLQNVSAYIQSLQAMYEATRAFARGGRPTYNAPFSSFVNAVQQQPPPNPPPSAPIVNFNSPISVGNGVSPQQLTTALTAVGATLVRALIDARSGT